MEILMSQTAAYVSQYYEPIAVIICAGVIYRILDKSVKAQTGEISYEELGVKVINLIKAGVIAIVIAGLVDVLKKYMM